MLTEFPKAPKLPRLFPRFVPSTALARPRFGLVASHESPANRCETLAAGVVRFRFASSRTAEATPSLKSGVLAIVPSWLLSLVLHAALFVVLAASLPGLRGGIVGDPDGDLRSVGIWVGHSGDGTDGDGAGSGQARVPSGETKLVPTAKPDACAQARCLDSSFC